MKTRFNFAALVAGGVLAGAVQAQTGVTVYGILDGAVEYYDNANAAGGAVVRQPTLGGGMFPSRLGIRGSEDLGGGLKAVFTLENGLAADTGEMAQAGRLFGRQANVGLAGTWGQLTVGRNYNMIYVSTADVDVFGPSQYGLGALDAAIPNGRSDNSLAYRGTFYGVTIGASYSFGRDTSAAGGASGTNCPGESASHASECREWSALLRYDGANWALVSAYDRKRGGPAAAAGLSSDDSDSRLHLAAYLRQSAWRLGGGVFIRNNQGSLTELRSRLYYLGLAYALTSAWTVDGQLAKLDYRASANDTQQILLRGVYTLSARTQVYLAAGRIVNHGQAAVALSAGGSVGAGLTQHGVITGVKLSF